MANETVSKITLSIGNGLTFDGNKLAVNTSPDSDIVKESDGLYVPNLSGGSSGTRVDNHTVVVESQNNRLRANRDVVQYIFAMSRYPVTNRDSVSSYSTNKSAIKTIDDIRNEFNAVLDASGGDVQWTTYDVIKGDLFMLRGSSHPAKYSMWPVAMDDGNRYIGDVCYALFVIDDVKKDGHYTNALKLYCLYSRTEGYTAGQTYTSGTF